MKNCPVSREQIERNVTPNVGTKCIAELDEADADAGAQEGIEETSSAIKTSLRENAYARVKVKCLSVECGVWSVESD